ncbi:MAG: hypothetical protein QMC96_13270, partial [Methanomicrobiales archaeon]|nr:hypothetical protein [Methanomicrobiales archaeon]
MRRRIMLLVSLIAIASFGFFAGAAAQGGYDGGNGQGEAPVGPALTLVEPQEGANLSGDTITVAVNVTNFSLVDRLGAANVPGEG